MKAIVSGATKGIGKAITLALANEGYDLGLGARNLEELDFLRKEIQAIYPNIEVITKSVDFSQKHETRNFAETFLNYWGDIDILVNNVGVYEEDSLDDLSENGLMNMFNVNFFSAMRLTQPFLPEFKKRKSGHIINICSVLSKKMRKRAVSYSLSKQALYSYTKILRSELRDYDVKVTAILPGSTNTASWDGLDAPVDDFVQPEDVANGVLMAIKSNGLVEEFEIKPINPKY
ncbi:SDR family oxidoreductase [Salibacteraceae bacterium]|jgi:short-subunit dehydrogenase|nr:short-chain dehydrogenase [Crocinitomicaceae bacterium]MDC1204705.1 SDR family oxidoreductase [Salibacteraceae bacterium]|tara:strand:- start:26109 stop:26804 length:696 start_codon:yes stop_codon:yes gene_type:complete